MPETRVLFADNKPDFLSVGAEFLEQAGYSVLRASSLQQARELLADARVNLMILDIRMVNDDDVNDLSGLDLARDPAYESLPKIILTGFPTYQAVRQVLGPAARGIPLAVDFLSKEEGLPAMLAAVERALADHVRISSALVVRWREREGLSFPHLAALIEPEADGIRLLERIGEVQDLFRRLFYEEVQITIDRLLWHRGGRVCVVVFAHSREGVTAEYAVVCGERARIRQELRSYEDCAPQVNLSSTLVGSGETLHFGALAYALSGADLERVRTLRACYHAHNAGQVVVALHHLFTVTLAPWHQGTRHVERANSLSKMYAERLLWPADSRRSEHLQQRMEALAAESFCLGSTRLELSQTELAVRFPGGQSGSYVNPVSYALQLESAVQHPVTCVRSPGVLNADNVLVDADGGTWLTDFAQTGQVPLLWDMVSLEAAVRFEMIGSTDLQALHDLERRLVEPKLLNDRLDVEDAEPAFRKALTVIRGIRRHAFDIGGADTRPYYEGLLFFGLSVAAEYAQGVGYTWQELARMAHGLLSAAMIHTKLQPEVGPSSGLADSAQEEIRIDESRRQAYVSGKAVDLTPNEYDLLVYLCHRQGELCTQAEIVRNVFKQEPGDKEQEVSRVNALLSRLRGKIESDPKHPRFLHNRRGAGHWLLVKGTGES